ncbi:hypothetical protein chiPu_0026682, partial [Chiloscyllium punctatum]|nr:hypothetical protein [Chiloscyllium punctatum]
MVGGRNSPQQNGPETGRLVQCTVNHNGATPSGKAASLNGQRKTPINIKR